MTQQSWLTREQSCAESATRVSGSVVVPAQRSHQRLHAARLPAQRMRPKPAPRHDASRPPRAVTAARVAQLKASTSLSPSWSASQPLLDDRRRTVPPRPALRREALVAGTAIVNLAVLLALVALLGLAIGPHTGAYRTTTMLTGSMRPLYPPGSVLVITPQKASDLAPGQVITYNAPIEDRRVVTHRVIAVDHTGPYPVMETKGDANNGPDPWKATVKSDTVWRVQGVVPHVGRAIQLLRDPRAQLVLTRGLPAVLLLSLLVSLWRPERKRA